MARALKVYRTPIGFHDAYVAAASQKAALKAWGTDTNLFARGSAEQVTQADLMREPLAHPGTVIKRPRGSEAEHLASLANTRPQSGRKHTRPENQSRAKPAARKRAASPPRPSRDALSAAEDALAQQESEAKAALALLEEQQARLRAEIERLRKKQQAAHEQVERSIDKERRKYDAALERWRAS